VTCKMASFRLSGVIIHSHLETGLILMPKSMLQARIGSLGRRHHVSCARVAVTIMHHCPDYRDG